MAVTVTPRLEALVGRLVIDVREYPEFAGGFVEGSRQIALSTISAQSGTFSRSEPILLVCRSGKRASKAAEQLGAIGFTNLEVLDGGILAWQAASLPLKTLEKKPWSLERQVRAIAGGLVLVFVSLGASVSPWFLAGAGFVGAGLVFAGLTDICMMATLLGRMPWNKAPETTSK